MNMDTKHADERSEAPQASERAPAHRLGLLLDRFKLGHVRGEHTLRGIRHRHSGGDPITFPRNPARRWR